ncbi:GH92 family glycosyl hydrolase [Arachidicoccus sp.]|uniref:GH92 family glycosyl hydrolase n=1 Tax=Arachidicoccus sp. TaxID=1872624 RepID=UPI003D22F4ED
MTKRKNKRVQFLILAFFAFCTQKLYAQDNLAGKVNTMIGTKASGNTYPGATYPFGMVQFTRSYFSPQSGFVINQLSGAGCDEMGNFPVLPLLGDLSISPDSIINLRMNVSKEVGSAGYYQATVADSIKAQFTVTKRTGFAKFTYPDKEHKATIIIGGGVAATPISTSSIVITGKNSCEGYADGGSFCGIATPYKVYFVAQFDNNACNSGVWKNQKITKNGTFAEGSHSGVYFTFDVESNKVIQYKIGVSYVSVENARKNLEAENTGWSFDKVKANAESKWNSCLNKIQIKSSDSSFVQQFYTHLYHSYIHPNICNDVNGEYMGADYRIHQTSTNEYTSFSNWDTYRTQIQLLSILEPDVASDVVQSLEVFAKQSGGGFPRWVLANVETGIMQGDPTAILIANAYAFGARNYDTRSILATMRHGAEDPTAHSQGILTRPGLQNFLDKGYYTNASMQLEYNSADFAISQFALHACNDEYISQWYQHKAQSWKKLYNPERKWLQSRNADGSWKNYDADWREATYKNYFWMVPFNLKALIDTIGGKHIAAKRLDSLFVRLDANYGQEWFASGNEPSFATPWAYNWTDAPYKAQAVVHRVLKEQYFDKPGGLPGNDDLGAMGAYYVFSALGLFPEIPGVGGFSITSPYMQSAVIHLKNGDLKIVGGSENKPYIKSLKFNGKKYESTWIDWSTIANGGTLQFDLSGKPNKTWGTTQSPPSFN